MDELPREMSSMMREREAVQMSGIRMVVGLEEQGGREERMERSQGEKRRRVQGSSEVRNDCT